MNPIRVEKLPSTLKVMEPSAIDSGVPEVVKVRHRVGPLEVRRFKDEDVGIERPWSLHVRGGPAPGDKLSVDDLLTAVFPSPPMEPEGGSRREEPHSAGAIDESTLGTEEATELLPCPNSQCRREDE